MDIKGKVFIVTGGASGLGEGTARMLAANGGKVVIADMQAEKGEAVAKDIGGVIDRHHPPLVSRVKRHDCSNYVFEVVFQWRVICTFSILLILKKKDKPNLTLRWSA